MNAFDYVDLDVETPIRTEAGIWDYDYEKREYVLRKPEDPANETKK